MFVEKKRLAISPPRLLTANGGADGTITVSNGSGFFVKQFVILKSSTQSPREFEIKRFINANTFKVGPRGAGITSVSDVSMFLTAHAASIEAPEQERPGIPDKDRDRAIYVEEPAVAIRTIGVDEFGRYYTTDNPFPVKESILKLTPKKGFNRVVIVRDTDGDPTQYQLFNGLTQTGFIDVTYDTNKNAIEYKGTEL